MKKSLLFTMAAIVAFYASAQQAKHKTETVPNLKEIKIPMEESLWEHDNSAVDFITYKNTRAAKSKNGNRYEIFLKDQVFKNGTIEFDVELIGTGFPGINFRMSADRKNGENFYIRSFGQVSPETRTTLQYAALIDGVSMWDLADEYQGGAVIYQQGWNHVKLVVSGKQMKAFVNDMSKPALVVPELESGRDSGSVSLSGNVIYANLVIKPDATDGLSADAGYHSTDNDTRYLRNWLVTPAVNFPFGKDIVMPLRSMYGKLVASDLPDSTAGWSAIKAESRSMINLSRLYGHVENDTRRLAWLKTNIQSDKVQERILSLGFSDEVWVFINGQLLYADKNYFGTPSQKTPDGRCTIENASLKIPLKKGNNEIVIALANYFYGWGIIARLDNTDGIKLTK